MIHSQMTIATTLAAAKVQSLSSLWVTSDQGPTTIQYVSSISMELDLSY